MATTVEQVTNQPKKRPKKQAADPFGGGIPMALVALAVTGIGFWRTFFSQLQHVSVPHLIHGGLSVAWLMLVLVQATLIRRGEYKWHRMLGWSSLALFAALVGTSWWMIALMLSPGNPLPFLLGKLFAYSDLATLPLLIILYGGAIALRKDRHIHSRLVSATMLVAIVPAVARMFNLLKPGMDGLILAMHPTYIFVLGILAIAIYVDWKNGRLRWPFPFAFLWFAITYATLFPAWQSQWFDALAHSVAATV